jgi:hypothetical protein
LAQKLQWVALSEYQKITNRHYSGNKSYLYLHKSCIICTLIFLEKKKSGSGGINNNTPT